MTGIEMMREWANELREAARAYRDGEIGYVPIDVEACQRKNAAKLDAIADQIKRETLPRPRFEDGEPVQFGDRFVANTGEVRQVARITCFDGGRFVLVSEYGHRYIVGEKEADGKRVKRPEPPKVLDADGVEIKVGDEVWDVRDDERPWIVEKIDGKRVICSLDEPEWHRRRSSDCSMLTHRRPEPPDTWERIEADVDSGEGYAGMDAAEAAADVLRRCKALAGVE